MVFDMHVHSSFSPDSETTLDAQCQRALSLGLDGFTLTDHIDFDHPETPPDFWPENLLAYTAAIEDAQQRYPALTLYKGIEMGYLAQTRRQTFDCVYAQPLDFILLSTHVVDGYDPYNPAFFEGRTQQEAYALYAREVLLAVSENDDFDAMAHFGYVAKFAPYPQESRPFGLLHAPDEIDKTLRLLISKGKVLEVNASRFTQNFWMPGADILKAYAALGGDTVTFGSDAHTPQSLGAGLPEAQAFAKACGIRYGAVFENRQAIGFTL